MKLKSERNPLQENPKLLTRVLVSSGNIVKRAGVDCRGDSETHAEIEREGERVAAFKLLLERE